MMTATVRKGISVLSQPSRSVRSIAGADSERSRSGLAQSIHRGAERHAIGGAIRPEQTPERRSDGEIARRRCFDGRESFRRGPAIAAQDLRDEALDAEHALVAPGRERACDRATTRFDRVGLDAARRPTEQRLRHRRTSITGRWKFFRRRAEGVAQSRGVY